MLPEVGFGTGTLVGNEAVSAVGMALDSGYRLIDTAARYNNEAEVGQAIAVAAVPREEILVVTKGAHEESEHGYQTILDQLEASLGRLSLKYVDFYLVHWPVNPAKRLETWRAMEKIQQSGRARAIGVSNYAVHHLQELGGAATQPAVNQIEFHPYVFAEQRDILQYCQEHGIAVLGHSTFANGQWAQDKVVHAIATAHNVSPQQVLSRWSVQHGVTPLVRSHNPEHIAQNIHLAFTLTENEMAVLNNLHGKYQWRDPHKLP